MASLLELNGGGPQKSPKYVPIFMDRSFTGLFTQRAVVHDPADIYTAKYYGGRPDALWAGANIELTNRLTLQRRPGSVQFTTSGALGFLYPTPPLTSYPFQLTDGTIRVVIDTDNTGISASLVLTSVATSSSGEAVYTGTIAGGAGNAYAGTSFTIAGFLTSANNGVFACVASTATTLTLLNASAVAESHAATAISIYLTSVAGSSTGSTVYTGTVSNGNSNLFVGMKFTISGFVNGVNNGTFVCTASTSTTLTLTTINSAGTVLTTITETTNANAVSSGAVYWDKQDGTAVLLFAKGVGAGQTHFIGSGGILFAGDGVETWKYTPLNTNGTIWNWGITAPSTQPGINVVASGSAASVWQASTVYSTMGLTFDAYNNAWQLIDVNSNPNNPNVTNAQYGTTGVGGPAWQTPPNQQTLETSGTPITWVCVAQLQDWMPKTQYGDAGTVGGCTGSIAIFDPGTKAIYVNYKGSGGFSASGNVRPPFTATPGWNYTETRGNGAGANGTLPTPHWFFFCTQAQAQAWKASIGYTRWNNGSSAQVPSNAVFEPLIMPPPTTGLNGNPPTPVWMQVPTNTGTSGSGYTPFPDPSKTPVIAGYQQADIEGNGQLTWQCVGTNTPLATYGIDALWHAGTKFTPWTIPGGGFSAIRVQVGGLYYMQVCKTATGPGISAAHQPGTSFFSGTATADNAIGTQTTYHVSAWTVQPSPGDVITIAGFVNAGNNGTFDVVSSTSTTVVVLNPGGVSETVGGITINLNQWGITYGAITTDGNLTWVCVGPPVAWAATTIWNLPLAGFAIPQASQAYGGSTIDASNGTVQTVISSGKSGTPTAPTWKLPTDVPNTVSEGPSSPQLEWLSESLSSTNSLAFKLGYSYGYSYKARALDDIYSPPPDGGIGGLVVIPPGRDPVQGGTGGALAAPTGSETNAVSSCSPANTKSGSNAGAVIFVSGAYSNDPQVDTIIIWRSNDGGGPFQMFELTEIPNIVGNPVGWTFQDFLPDVPTSAPGGGQFPGLNTEIPAPINGVNDPPAVTALPMAYNYTRIWEADGQYAVFSGGPDTKVGNPDEAFSVSDSLPFLAPVTRIVRISQGLVALLTDSVEVIAGGPATSSFFSITMAPGIGLLDYNALDIYTGEIMFFASDNQFRLLTPALSVQNAGFPLGDQFANQPTSGTMSSGLAMTWDPKHVYVASHQSGTDNCVFVSDGNTGWYRLNARQAGAMPNAEPVWSPYAIVTNGCQMVMSVETSPGIKKLLIGSQAQGQPITVRNQTTFTDSTYVSGTGVVTEQYDAFFEMGNITLAHAGQLALLKFCEFDFSTPPTFSPTVSYLLNEISGTFTPFVTKPVFDPPSLYGATLAPGSYSPLRYYFASNAALARCRHLRLRVDYGKTSNGDEMFNATIFGRLMIET